jgi:hypothetical protein
MGGRREGEGGGKGREFSFQVVEGHKSAKLVIMSEDQTLEDMKRDYAIRDLKIFHLWKSRGGNLLSESLLVVR